MSSAQSRHLLGSEKELIADLLRPFLGTCLDKASKFAFERWVQSGAWQQEGDGDRTLDAIGCALLKSPPIPLYSFVAGTLSRRPLDNGLTIVICLISEGNL